MYRHGSAGATDRADKCSKTRSRTIRGSIGQPLHVSRWAMALPRKCAALRLGLVGKYHSGNTGPSTGGTGWQPTSEDRSNSTADRQQRLTVATIREGMMGMEYEAAKRIESGMKAIADSIRYWADAVQRQGNRIEGGAQYPTPQPEPTCGECANCFKEKIMGGIEHLECYGVQDANFTLRRAPHDRPFILPQGNDPGCFKRKP